MPNSVCKENPAPERLPSTPRKPCFRYDWTGLCSVSLREESPPRPGPGTSSEPWLAASPGSNSRVHVARLSCHPAERLQSLASRCCPGNAGPGAHVCPSHAVPEQGTRAGARETHFARTRSPRHHSPGRTAVSSLKTPSSIPKSDSFRKAGEQPDSVRQAVAQAVIEERAVIHTFRRNAC
jgi:hypothetical protein